METLQIQPSDAPLVAPSPQLFQNAAGFDIFGSHFVSGDVHYHARSSSGPTRGSSTLRSPVIAQGGENNTAPPISLGATSDYSESEIYCSQLLRQKRGFPLYVPGPQRTLPQEYQRNGVRIGDVGRVTPEGAFDFFFNIYLPADHPINRNDVPEDFFPLTPYLPQDLVHLEYDPGDCVSAPLVQREQYHASLDFPGGEFVFNSFEPTGAILALPHGAHLERLGTLGIMRRYAANNAESWYKYANQTRGRELANGSLYLITGSEKAKSWGIASFRDVVTAPQDKFQLVFAPTADADAGYKYRWYTGPAHQKHADAPSIDGTPLNQSTFIHAFAISLGEGIWGRLFRDVEVCQLVDSQLRFKPGQGFVPHGSQGSALSSFFNLFLGGGGGGGGSRDSDENCVAHDSMDENVVISDAAPTSKIIHPSQIISEYILREAPQARIVITHSDDWRDLLSHELLQQIAERFDIVEDDGPSPGAMYLKSRSDSTLSGEKDQANRPPRSISNSESGKQSIPPFPNISTSENYSGHHSRMGSIIFQTPQISTAQSYQPPYPRGVRFFTDKNSRTDTASSTGQYPSTSSASRLPLPIPNSSIHAELFVCEICGKDFSRAHDIKRHHETQHEVITGTFICVHCNKDFTRADALKRHLQNKCDEPPSEARWDGVQLTLNTPRES
ncbi:hypothetical protein B0H11DRAFT_2040246 [Mycena galericulata]|nr:hypothetical protein B0H11DRAFT_2040246 [Mycena galericulata]